MGKVAIGPAASSIILALGIVAGGGLTLAGEESGLAGRVRITPVTTPETVQYEAVQRTLAARFAPAPDKAFADVRVISVRPRAGDPTRFDATIYDYASEKGFELVLDTSGNEIGRTALMVQPAMSLDELRDAVAIVERSSVWSGDIASGAVQIYDAMPAITVGADGRRLINVGVMRQIMDKEVHGEGGGEHFADGPDLAENEIVSVHIRSGDIVRHAAGAPQSSLATLFACGPSSGGGGTIGSCTPSSYHVVWPAASPVWKFDVWHPNCTNAIQGDGTGLSLQNVYYNDHLVIKQADVPVLNVLYDGNACGPYRDWLDSEDSMSATGVDVPGTGSGFRVTTGNPPPTTFCETGIDAGNFKGVAIHDEGASLLLRTETNAGWYRYVMEWRLWMDGTIEPIFGFGATSNSCTCNPHFHHAYWRFEFALDGDATNQSTGIATLERVVSGTTDQWTPVTSEAKFTRPVVNPELDWWRIKNPVTGLTYILKPGATDSSAQGNAYAKGDYWALAYNTGQINDPNSDTSINADSWINGEAIGTTKRLVLWYRAGYYHSVPGGDTDPCELAGPRLEFSQPCRGSIMLDKPRYGCEDTLNMTLSDSDLVGAGTQNVTVQSTTESTPETVTLTESPASSGHFQGTIATTALPPAHGDGKLSVADGNAVTVHYVDVSACGTPNTGVDKATTADCIAPVISNVQINNVTDSSANVTWTTNENANSRVTYGTSIPPASYKDDLGTYSTSHSLDIGGLAGCTPHVLSVTSADIAGNSATASSGGAYYAFATKARSFVAGPDDVEAGTGIWTASGTAGSVWHVDTCKASSPTHAWKAGSATCPGTYGNTADTHLTSQRLIFGPAGHGYHLRYKEFYKTQSAADLCTPQISTDGGTSWINLAQYSGASGAWIARDYDLAAFTGSNIKIRFWFHSDASTADEGWYLDDLDVSRISACSAEVKRQSSTFSDGCSAGGAGSGNGVLEPGEDTTLRITASNLGIAAATGLTATLSTTSLGVTITTAHAVYPDIPAGGAAMSLAPHFSFTLGSELDCGIGIEFTVRFQSNEGAWSEPFDMLLGAGGVFSRLYSSGDVPKQILDNATVTSNLNIPDTGVITDVNAALNITHTYDGDLALTLIAPNNSRIALSTRHGNSSDNYTNTVFDDEAATPIASGTPPFTGSFRPDGLLSGADGTSAAGLWKLEVADQATQDTGTITSWSITVSAATPPVCNACAQGLPGEAGPISWLAGSKTSLQWPSTPATSWYTLYRGTQAGLPNLANAGVDSCRAYLGTGLTATGVGLPAPPAGSIHWYLVTAANGSGEGSAGAGASGPRIVNSAGDCP